MKKRVAYDIRDQWTRRADWYARPTARADAPALARLDPPRLGERSTEPPDIMGEDRLSWTLIEDDALKGVVAGQLSPDTLRSSPQPWSRAEDPSRPGDGSLQSLLIDYARWSASARFSLAHILRGVACVEAQTFGWREVQIRPPFAPPSGGAQHYLMTLHAAFDRPEYEQSLIAQSLRAGFMLQGWHISRGVHRAFLRWRNTAR